MQRKYLGTVFISSVLLILLVILGCAPGQPLSNSENTPTATPGLEDAPTLTPTSSAPHPLPDNTATPTPTATPHGLSYEAVGQAGISYSGTICDLGKPFTLTSQSQYNDITIQFTPSSSEDGAFILKGSLFGGAGGVGVTYIDGSGDYSVTRTGGKATQLVLNVVNASGWNTAGGGDTGGGFQIFIDLAETKKCD